MPIAKETSRGTQNRKPDESDVSLPNPVISKSNSSLQKIHSHWQLELFLKSKGLLNSSRKREESKKVLTETGSGRCGNNKSGERENDFISDIANN